MEYNVYEWKKTLRKYRLHILIGLFVLVFVGVLVFFVAHSSNRSSHSADNSIQSPSSEPQKETTREKPTTTINLSSYKILNTYVREGKQYYTQGLVFKDADTLIESAGLYKQSAIHYLNFPSMTVGLEAALGKEYFGEGCELIENNGAQEIYQLTWKERKIFVWDANNLNQKRSLDLPLKISEGWGISKRIESNNGKEQMLLYISDGSSQIFVVDPITLNIQRTIKVRTHDGKEVEDLNELEFVGDYLWANIYLTNNIAVIDIDTGYVDYMINLAGLDILAKQQALKMGMALRYGDVLNGIAYDPKNDRLIIAGKKWPLMWEIKVDGI